MQDSSGIYGEAMDDSLSRLGREKKELANGRFLVSSQALSDQNLQWLEIPWVPRERLFVWWPGG